MDHRTKVSPNHAPKPYPKPPPHIHPLTIHHHPTHPLHTIEQVRSTVKWASLFSCSCCSCCSCCCFRSWHKSSSKALQMTYKSLPKLQEADDEKRGNGWRERDLLQLWLSYGYTGLLINRPILTTEYQSPPPYVLRTFTRHLPCTPLSHNWTSAEHC